MKQKVKNKKRTICLFIIILILAYFLINFIHNKYSNVINIALSHTLFNSDKEYGIIKEDTNSNYLGIGQEKVKDKDGYFTIFTTINENKKTYTEYKQNGKSSWSDKKYWDADMKTSGCGITAMSIILSGYGKNYTPEDLREKYYPVLNGNDISKELSNTFGIQNSDFYYDSSHLSDNYIIDYLKSNRPILICIWAENGDNRWTTASHYMVLLATDGADKVYVSNPNRFRE